MALLKKLKELHPESNADKKINNNATSTEQKKKIAQDKYSNHAQVMETEERFRKVDTEITNSLSAMVIHYLTLFVNDESINNKGCEKNFFMAEQLFAIKPIMIHIKDRYGTSMLDTLIEKKLMVPAFILIQKYAMQHLVTKASYETEPLCFNMLKTNDLYIINSVNEYIVKSGLKIYDANGEPWSRRYNLTVAQIKNDVKVTSSIFTNYADDNYKQIKYKDRNLIK